MAAQEKAGAKAPAITVHGLTFTPNTDYAESWEALELQMQLANVDEDNFARMRIYFDLLEGISGLTIDEIVEAAGGRKAPATKVVAIAAEIVEACIPKK